MTECQKADQTKSRKVTRNAVYNNNEQLNINQRGMHKFMYDYDVIFGRKQGAARWRAVATAATAAAIAIATAAGSTTASAAITAAAATAAATAAAPVPLLPPRASRRRRSTARRVSLLNRKD